MSSRDCMLASLRRAAVPLPPLPGPVASVQYADREQQFAQVFTAVGGTFLGVATLAEISPKLEQLEFYKQARKIVSLVPGAGRADIDLVSLESPHELAGLDVAILPGDLAVAENGAVWVSGNVLVPHRAIFVVTQHLVLVVPARRIVHTMHEAYGQIRIERPGFGVFISGPSKTADIEQSLVIGAHGPRSCSALLLAS